MKRTVWVQVHGPQIVTEDSSQTNTAAWDKDSSEKNLVTVQGCQMAYFQTKNPDLGKFWRVLQWKMLVFYIYAHLVYFTTIRYCYFATNRYIYVVCMVIWYILTFLVGCSEKNLATLYSMYLVCSST
jgi:hypothetical protein